MFSKDVEVSFYMITISVGADLRVCLELETLTGCKIGRTHRSAPTIISYITIFE